MTSLHRLVFSSGLSRLFFPNILVLDATTRISIKKRKGIFYFFFFSIIDSSCMSLRAYNTCNIMRI